MTRIVAAGPAPASGDQRRLRDVATQIEGVFVAEMFKAMRATVPAEGDARGGAGEEIFTAMMDGRISEAVARGLSRGVADAITRQLGRRA
ncbi:MAG: rod-binding protein [Gemmatimonadaceae bacterium]|nr:rod-binding protein [Gemmatimonadaceae bacterium]